MVLTPESREQLSRLERRDPKAARDIDTFLTRLETTPDIGHPLRGEWEGCLSAHVAHDRHRVVWELGPAEEDYEQLADVVVPVMILAVGPKTDARGRTIYDRSRRPDAD